VPQIILHVKSLDLTQSKNIKKHQVRVSVQGVGGHFACLCRWFDFYEVKKILLLFFKKKMEILNTFNHNYSEKSSKRANSTNHPV
jgi:hypothetical protein